MSRFLRIHHAHWRQNNESVVLCRSFILCKYPGLLHPTSPRVFMKQKRNFEKREYKGTFVSGRRQKSGNAAAITKFNSYFHMQSPTTEQVTQQLNSSFSRSEAEIDAEVDNSSLDFVLREGTL